MENLDIRVGPLSLSEDGEPVGQIWFVQNNEAFPDEGWEDFPCAIIYSMLISIDLPPSREKLRQRVSFYEGDFEIAIYPLDGRVVRLEFFEAAEKVLVPIEIEADVLRLQLISVLTKLLSNVPLQLRSNSHLRTYEAYLNLHR